MIVVSISSVFKISIWLVFVRTLAGDARFQIQSGKGALKRLEKLFSEYDCSEYNSLRAPGTFNHFEEKTESIFSLQRLQTFFCFN